MPKSAKPAKSAKSAKPATPAGERAPRARRASRIATENALMEAAMRLLERDGVLSGLNMQETADEAGVNRGLIHLYFGNRRALLRAAIDRGLQLEAPDHEERRTDSPARKGARHFADYVGDPRYPQLIALLALDGDETFEPIPFATERIEDTNREREAGVIADDVDLEAMLVAWDATLLGYALLRMSAGRQLGIPVPELDERVFAMITRQSQTLAGPAAQRPSAGRARRRSRRAEPGS